MNEVNPVLEFFALMGFIFLMLVACDIVNKIGMGFMKRHNTKNDANTKNQ